MSYFTLILGYKLFEIIVNEYLDVVNLMKTTWHTTKLQDGKRVVL
jgi:hypothetical protein